jgi:hypothetical protein
MPWIGSLDSPSAPSLTEAPEEAEEVIEVLAGQARRLLLPDQIGLVTGRAVMQVGEPPPFGDLGGIGGRWTAARRLGLIVGGEVRHVGVAQVLGEGCHLRISPAPVLVLDELPVGEERRLSGQRRRPRNRRIAVLAMAHHAHLRLPPPGLEIRGMRRAARRLQGRQQTHHRAETLKQGRSPSAPTTSERTRTTRSQEHRVSGVSRGSKIRHVRARPSTLAAFRAPTLPRNPALGGRRRKGGGAPPPSYWYVIR